MDPQAMATTTDVFHEDKLSVASKDSMGVQFLRRAIEVSMQVHSYRYSHREEHFRQQYPQLATIRQWLHALLENRRRGDRLDNKSPGRSRRMLPRRLARMPRGGQRTKMKKFGMPHSGAIPIT